MKAGKLSPPLRICGINYDSLADGAGIRTAIFFSGCDHHCPGCHNQEAQNVHYGSVVTETILNKIADEIAKRPYLSGITLTGGDPLYLQIQTEDFLYHLKEQLAIREVKAKTVWLYTGSIFETVSHLPIFKLVDVCVDGPFLLKKADKTLAFRGSSNQRIIDVQESLRSGETVILSQYMNGV